MKKTMVLFVAAALLTGSLASTASAIDFKAKGSFQFAFDYINGGNFMDRTRAGKNVPGQQWSAMRQQRDNFEAIQRVHLQLQAIASESLSGTVFFEIGEQRWGMGSQGGALGADGTQVKVKHAYIDWTVPSTALKLRMGIQGVKLPGFALDNPVLHTDVAGITASYKINDNVSLTALWMRPYNDYWTGDDKYPAGYMDNFDLGVLMIPLSFDGIKVTPWFMAGALGPKTMNATANANTRQLSTLNPSQGGQALDGLQVKDGLYPAAFSSSRPAASMFSNTYTSLYWGGITTDITALDPFRIRFDAIYGGTQTERQDLNRAGWFAMLALDYSLQWGTPGLYGWYFSGDDDNPHNGSERLPYVATTNNLTNSLSSFGYRGNPIMGGGKGILGTNPNGTWGIGARLQNMTFLERITHTVRVNFMGGTNNPSMAKYITGRTTKDDSGRTVYRNNTDFNSFGTYLTTADTGVEVNFDTSWKPYDNLTILLETGYIHLWLDNDTWGKYGNIAGDSLHYKDAWKASLNVIYQF